jgi:hypothetical protein
MRRENLPLRANSDRTQRSKKSLLDHRVGVREHRWGNFEAKHFEIGDKLNFVACMASKFSRLSPGSR